MSTPISCFSCGSDILSLSYTVSESLLDHFGKKSLRGSQTCCHKCYMNWLNFETKVRKKLENPLDSW